MSGSGSQIAYDVDPIYGCWLWTGRIDARDGYGIVWRGKRPSRAHRVVYEQEVGPIPEGLELDHACRRLLCVAPYHLEPVTRNENELRKSWRYRAKRTRCKAGHDMTVAIVTPEGGRVCRQCNKDAKGAAL